MGLQNFKLLFECLGLSKACETVVKGCYQHFWTGLCLTVLLSVLPSFSALAASDKVSSSELAAQKELLQTQIEAVKALQQKDADAINKRIDDQLAQVGQGVDRFGVIAGLLGTGITVLLVLLGWMGYRNAKSEAKEIAQDSATDAAKKWFSENSIDLNKEINELREKAIQGKQEIDKQVSDVQTTAEGAHSNIRERLDTLNNALDRPNSPDTPEKERARSEVKAYNEQLKTKNEDTFSFDDWDTRAFAAVNEKNLEDAAYFWFKASKIDTATDVQVARVLYNRATAQGKLGQSEAAIATYEEVIRRYGDAPEFALREQVARAIFSKGVIQGQQGQSEAAVVTFQEVIRRYGDAPEVALREVVAQAMFNKGATQGQQGQRAAEIATYEEVIRRYGDAPEVALCEQVAKAMFNKGFRQGQLGQSEAKIATYEELIRRYGDAPEVALRERVADAHNGIGFILIFDGKALFASDPLGAKALWRKALEHTNKAVAKLEIDKMDGLILGNQAYALALLDNIEQAEPIFAQALRSPVSGGKTLYDGTLTDFDIHPIAKDQAMRDLVERQWRIWTAEEDKANAPKST